MSVTKKLFFSSFETENEAGFLPSPSKSRGVTSPEKLPAGVSLPADMTGLCAVRSHGPAENWGGRMANCGWTGQWALTLLGHVNAPASATLPLFTGLNIPVTEKTCLSYMIFPDAFTAEIDLSYVSHALAVDLCFTDGTTLEGLSLSDQNGHIHSARNAFESRSLFTREWNYIHINLAGAQGKVIDQILVRYEKASGDGDILTFIDDILIAEEEEDIPVSPADDILITRGTMNDVHKSRGLMIPAVCVPNAFNFWAPSTYTDRFFYDYQASAIAQFGCTHQASYHLLDHGVLHFMPNIRVLDATEKEICAEARRSHFSHANEIAHAHEYTVKFDEDSPAGKTKVEMTPTDHAAVVRVTYPEGALCRNLIFDADNTSGLIHVRGSIDFEGCRFRAFVDYQFPSGTTGATLLYVFGEFSEKPEKVQKIKDCKRPLAMVSFAPGCTQVVMKIATSYISVDQARRNLEMEVGDASYEDICKQARDAWDALLGIIDVQGATPAQRITLRSSLYRMYAYPTNYSENIGTKDAPHIVYTSPYRSQNEQPVLSEGQLYTTNGFWDTYRTAWPAYALLTPDRDTALLNGIIQHYREAGWIGRWLNPAALNCMVGTSYDVVFADALAKGVSFDTESAYAAALRSAACPPVKCYGRADNEHAPFSAYTRDGICWTMENALSDAAISRMSALLGKRDEALYYANRALFYKNVFHSSLGFFVQKDGDGHFIVDADTFCPTKWEWGYVETNAWGTAFTVPEDPAGLAALYGGKAGLAKKLDEFFAAPALHTRDNGSWQHEMFEAADIRLGQYQHSNQPAHHILYMYNCAGEPWKTQRLTRDVLDRLFVGSEIGQGIYGDEDNGEQSAWYILTALGFYPMNAGSDEYQITSPLFDCVTLHLPGGDLTIRTIDNNRENVYIQSMTIDGEPYRACVISHDRLIHAHEIVFRMGNAPSDFGTGEDSAPLSITPWGQSPEPLRDRTQEAQIFVGAELPEEEADTDLSRLLPLFDDNSLTEVTFADGTLSLTFDFEGATHVQILTVACGSDPAQAPDSLRFEGWNEERGGYDHLDERTALSYEFSNEIKPYAPLTSGEYSRYRLTLVRTDGKPLTVSEIELLG